jgi:hypothetical protein
VLLLSLIIWPQKILRVDGWDPIQHRIAILNS